MCFGRVPPEINSGRMLYGSGSISMARAAASWDELAANLCRAATHCCATAVSLVGGWPGVVAIAIERALAPYIAWLNAAAALAEQAATQASAAVDAHETALAAVVHPDVIDSNRAELRSLAATNCLALASPEIARIEAEYEQMWVADAEVMYDYARASANASTLTPFGSSIVSLDRPQTEQPDINTRRAARALASAPEVIAAGQEVVATIPLVLHAISSSPQTTLDVHLLPVTSALSKLCSLSCTPEVAVQNLLAMNKNMMLLRAAVLSAPADQLFAAGFGRATAAGTLSVPACWFSETVDAVVSEPRYEWAREPLRLVKNTGAR